jgi:hypothetical protein
MSIPPLYLSRGGVRRLEIGKLIVALTQYSYFVYFRGDPGLRSDLRSHREVTFSLFPVLIPSSPEL